MKYILTSLLSLTVLLSFGQSLQTVESVEYDHENQRFLVSNGNSIIAIDQSTGELSYFGNATASYGMEIMNGNLFAISDGLIQGFDLASGGESMSLSIPGSGFLNGMASNGESTIWVTDFSNDRIYEIDVSDLQNPTWEIVVSNTNSTPNGIVYDDQNNRLVFVNWGNNAPVKAVDLADYSVSTLTDTNLGNCDGIDNDSENNFYVSSWSPLRISKFNSTFSGTPETIIAPGISNPADICYAKQIDTLAIPNSGNNTVTFIGFDTAVGIEKVNSSLFNFQIFGNPVTEQSYLSFNCEKSSDVTLNLVDINGKIIETLISNQRIIGQYKVLLNGIDFDKGIYFATLQIDQITTVKKLIYD
ncbi:T9SS type A sorting domain-containing protein [Cryomorpha ignava]|uniref:T9SS type A sorting domain-containing protein n=1 Tax=Cryomorpha ignava TaxID=101383 RepID=A0A7K3WMC8_9FLAO|nr:T9SS type A sorting domain-containing protein [Cryomorpha ignava]NEN22803.1 T9SS type A sorting domain-containing protein [Cryomorpha ignava]